MGLHWREWTKDELIQLFTEAGFSLKFHKYGMLTNNVSSFPRKQLISLMYALMPYLRANQVGVFVRNERGSVSPHDEPSVSFFLSLIRKALKVHFYLWTRVS